MPNVGMVLLSIGLPVASIVESIEESKHSVTCACGLAFEENHTVANTPMGRRCSLCFAALDSIIGGGL